jgi:hypothetical protein
MRGFGFSAGFAGWIALTGLGCSSSQGSNDAGATDASTNDAGSGDGGTGPDCNLPTILSQSMELTTACDPWIISAQGTTVERAGGGSAPVLKIDPGVTVAVAAGGFLDVGPMGGPATLQVNGTQANPAKFTAAAGSQTPGSWVGIELDEQSNGSSLSWTTVSYAGAPGIAKYAAALVVLGGTASNMVLLNNVTVQHNGGSGFNFAGHTAGLASGSQNLAVSDSPTGSYPIVIDANEAGTLPTSLTLAASGRPVVALDCQDPTAGNGCGDPMAVDHTQTWPALQVPYQVMSQAGINVEGSSSLAILSIAAPNTLQFVDGSSFLVDTLGTGYGELIANGTSANHIVFKSMDASPAWNAWLGLRITAGTANTLALTSLNYCDISDATGFLASENINANQQCSGMTEEGTLYLDGTNFSPTGTLGPSVTNCTFTNFGGCAILTDMITSPYGYGPYDDITACELTPQGGNSAGNSFTPASVPDAGPLWVQSDVCTFDP